MEELLIMKLPSFIGDLTDPGEVRKLNRPDETELPTILGGRDGCQAWAYILVLQKVPSEFYPKVCNYGEGPY